MGMRPALWKGFVDASTQIAGGRLKLGDRWLGLDGRLVADLPLVSSASVIRIDDQWWKPTSPQSVSCRLRSHRAVADWQLSASAFINGNDKNWVVCRLSAFRRGRF